MRKNYQKLLFIFCFSFKIIFCQQFEWSSVFGAWAYDYGYSVTTDNASNVYLTGKYEQQVDFNGLQLNSIGNHDFFLAKFSSQGNIQWARSGGGIYGDYATAICLSDQSLYIAGEIEGYGTTVYFDNSPFTLQVNGDNDMFLARYDLNGSLLWAKSAGGFQSDKALGICMDPNGNAVVCGYFTDSLPFDGNFYLTGNGYRDLFLAKYDSLGNFLWGKSAGSFGRDEAKAVVCDVLGNIYITGMFSHTVDFGGVSLTSPNGYYDMFIAKYDALGNLIWVRSGSSNFDEVGWGITTDAAGKIYVGGEFNAYALFDSLALTTSGMADFFVSCYDALGNIQWVQKGGGALIDRARGIGSDGQNILVTGQFGGQIQLGSSVLQAADSSDIFVASINSAGNYQWALSVDGGVDSLEQLGYESGNSVCADLQTNSVYFTGSLLCGGIFGQDTLSGFTRTDIFVSKISQFPLVVSEINPSDNLTIYPNPSDDIFFFSYDDTKDVCINWRLTDFSGNVLLQYKFNQATSSFSVSTKEWAPGIYFVSLLTERNCVVKPLIINH